MRSPTQLSLQEMRKRGYRCEVVEHFHPILKIRKDLFGCIDILCIGPSETVAIQATSRQNMSSRLRKIADAEAIGDMRDANWTILVHGWDQPDGKGTRYRLKEVDVS